VSTSPSRVSAILFSRGLGELGDELKRRLQYLEYLQELALNQQAKIQELESLLPDDVKEQRRQEQEERAAAARGSGGGFRRAPAESDG